MFTIGAIFGVSTLTVIYCGVELFREWRDSRLQRQAELEFELARTKQVKIYAAQAQQPFSEEYN